MSITNATSALRDYDDVLHEALAEMTKGESVTLDEALDTVDGFHRARARDAKQLRRELRTARFGRITLAGLIQS
jgi:hypothetical protein